MKVSKLSNIDPSDKHATLDDAALVDKVLDEVLKKYGRPALVVPDFTVRLLGSTTQR